MDAALEVAVAAEHRGDREILGIDALRDDLGKRSAVADARGAPIADQVEAQLLERAEQARALEVVGDDARSGRERGLDIVGRHQSAGDGVAREQTRGDHDRRVRRVGARRDRGDDDRSVADQVGVTADRPGIGCLGHAVGVDAALVLLAASTSPSAVTSFDASVGCAAPRHCVKDSQTSRQRDTVLGSLRAGDARDDAREVELDRLAEGRDLRVVGAEHALFLRIALDQVDVVGSLPEPRRYSSVRASTGNSDAVAPNSGDMLESVARSGTDIELSPLPQNSTNLLTTPCLRSISVSVSTRSVAVVPAGSALWNRTPTTTGASRKSGWPSMQASASMPPTPQPSTPMPLTIGVCESVPTSVSGSAMRTPSISRTCTTCARYSRLI